MYKLICPLFFFLAITAAGIAHATDYFILDFEDGEAPPAETGLPVWSLPAAFEKNYGPGNFFEVTDSTAHSGKYSLRFSYEGKNDFCNTCGIYRITHKRGLDGVDFFVADNAKDLTETKSDPRKAKKNKNKNKNQNNRNQNNRINKEKPHKHKNNKNHKNKNNKKNKKNRKNTDKGPAAAPGRIVYNRSNGYSRWLITEVGDHDASNDKLSLKLLDAGTNGEPPEFNSNDKIAIARQCGIDGHVGRNIDRRNDCDKVINWFKNVPAQTPGTSIFRRAYYKYENIEGGVHQKLHFFRPGTARYNTSNIVTYADSRKTEHMVPMTSGFGKKYGGAPIYRPGRNGMPGNLRFMPNTWYYMEEEYRAATPDLNADPNGGIFKANGEYRLWFARSGEESPEPVLEVTNLTMPPIRGGGKSASFWGNVQHMQDTRGYWYMDDIKISDKKIGPAESGVK